MPDLLPPDTFQRTGARLDPPFSWARGRNGDFNPVRWELYLSDSRFTLAIYSSATRGQAPIQLAGSLESLRAFLGALGTQLDGLREDLDTNPDSEVTSATPDKQPQAPTKDCD